MKLLDLREKRAMAVAEMQGLVETAERENRDLAESERQRFDQLKGETRALDQRIQNAEHVAALERVADVSETLSQHGGMGSLERRVSLLAVIRAQTFGTPLTGAEAEYSRETERRLGRPPGGAYVPLSALETRVNTTTSAPEIVPVEHRPDQYIGPFRRALFARRLGARVLSGLRGDLSIPKYGTGLTTGWVDENEALTESNMTFDSVSLTPHHAGALTELSRQLVQQSSPDVEDLVRSDMGAALAQAIDAAMIDGGATAKEPTGILRASGTLSSTLAGPTWAQVLAMVGQVEDQSVPGPLNWLLSPKTARVLRGTGHDVTEEYLMADGRMGEVQAYASAQVPNVDATHGVAILGDFTQVMLGIWSELDILVNPYAETPKGNIYVRAMSTVDVAIRRPEAFAIADDVPIPA
jgi:HK97 family phage major capsid protein